MKKQLILGGCSMVADYVHYRNSRIKENIKYLGWCDKEKKYKHIEWKYLTPWPTIDSILAKEYNLIPINLAKVAAGNKQIYNRLSDYILENNKNIDLVIVCWTSFTRLDFELQVPINNNEYKSILYTHYYYSERNKIDLGLNYDIWKMLYDIGHIFPKKDIDDFYRYSIMLNLLCETYNIKLIQAFSFCSPNEDSIIKMFLNHKMFSHVDNKYFYGWPVFDIIGGKCLDDLNPLYMINKSDRHFNELGTIKAAKRLSDFIKERKILA